VPEFAPSLPGQADPGVLPDIDAMERLVNELFSALPGGSPSSLGGVRGISGSGLQAGSGLPSILAPAVVPSLSVPSSVRGDPHRAAADILAAAYAMPDESTLRALLAGSSHGVPNSSASAQSAPAQAGSAASPLNAPALDVPAALVSEAELSRGSALPGATDPFQLDALSAMPGISQFGVPASRAGAGSPLTAPAIDRPDALPGSTYYFVDAARAPLRGTPAVPGSADGAAGFGPAVPPLDVLAIRRDFPILQERVNGRPLIWFDNAATTQKPRAVIDRLTYFYEHENSNIHRAAHELAARATDAYEGAREKVRGFLNAASANEIIFVRGTTEGINLVAQSWGRANIVEGDEIVVSHLEHHANIVPWQQLCAEKGARLRVAPVDECGQILLDEYGKLLGPKTRLVAFTQVSNALGTVTPARQMVAMAHAAGAKVLVDGAQSVSHMPVNVQDLDSDWFVFSGHKVFAPTGIGVVHGKEALLNATPPWQGGGNMIRDVTFEHTEYHAAPTRFEAGTGNIADAVGLGAAIDYVGSIGIARIAEYEHYLLRYATDLITQIPGLRLIGTAADKASVLSFVLEGFEAEEVGKALNQEGIAVRAGHHCAQPILRRFGLEATVRASLAFYNTCAEVDALIAALRRMRHARRVVVP
jgi:cysteine desulfurase/selenocysteine lyase